MPTHDQDRLASDRARPRIVELWWALRPLTSVLRVMQSGAHPDDEMSAMLAALSIRDGVNLSYACSTRGEGGQNDIGTESGAALGALRTREMERACDVLNMRMYWHSETPSDLITDFGFSKSGDETLGIWGAERTLTRFVEIVRLDRPDILIPTFLDVPGQHGHHRAMTNVAHKVMKAAADPGFPSNLPPWQISKMYLPAWSGAGQAYDDDEPPPPATLVVDGSGRDPVSGWNWARIGQQSRAYHRTQGMGRWAPATTQRDWPLHLAESFVDEADLSVHSGCVATFEDMAALSGAAPIADDLLEAGKHLSDCVAAFPDFEAVAEQAARALEVVKEAISKCPDTMRPLILHRLKAKADQLGQVLRWALGVEVNAGLDSAYLSPGVRAQIQFEVAIGNADGVEASIETPRGWDVDEDGLTVSPSAGLSDVYRAFYDPAVPPSPSVRAEISFRGTTATYRSPMIVEPIVLPQHRSKIEPASHVINMNGGATGFKVRVSETHPTSVEPELDLPGGWTAKRTKDGFDIETTASPAPGSYEIPILLGDTPAHQVRRIEYPHIANTAEFTPATMRVQVLDVEVPNVRVGYIGGGNDRVGHWLAAIGADVTELAVSDLSSDATLENLDTIVVGIFAMRFAEGLVELMPRLHNWVEAGGTLLTLYHRPWDNWDPDTIPPRRLEIGQPSLRWRVTDQTAKVHPLSTHPILESPNKIEPGDWDGWVKERGLYFAKSFDDAYTPLLEMSDPGEKPLNGALLVADIGQGRHIHTSLILHHQMEHLVPGAFRLMANFINTRE